MGGRLELPGEKGEDARFGLVSSTDHTFTVASEEPVTIISRQSHKAAMLWRWPDTFAANCHCHQVRSSIDQWVVLTLLFSRR